ncbi:MAG: ATP-binding protein [Anaerolineae bacterium]
MKRIGDYLSKETLEARRKRQPEQAAGGPAESRFPLASQPEVCPICHGRGFLVYDVPPGHPDFNRLIPCRCTEARLAAERARALREVSNMGALERLTFDNFLPEGVGLPEALRRALHQAYELCVRFAQEPEGWLVLLGGYGSGKTHLAAAIANYNLSLGRPAMFVVVPDLLDYLRAAFGPSSETGLDERLEAIRTTPLLILDDFGAHNSTPWAQEKLFQILNHRYNSRLPTVITTNQRLEDLDPRIASRLADLGLSQVFEIPAPDFRAGQDSLGFFDRTGRGLSSLALHADQTFENFSLRTGERLEPDQLESLRRAYNLARAFAEQPSGWLVFQGTYGCGKTHLAAAIANYRVASGQPAPMFVVVPDLLDHLRATFSPTSTTTLDRVFEQVKTAPLLILDDLGTESATPWAREKLFQLLNYRYAARLPTVITTFNTLEELDARLASRMMDSRRCTICEIIAPSFRGSPSQQQPVPKRSARKPRP